MTDFVPQPPYPPLVLLRRRAAQHEQLVEDQPDDAGPSWWGLIWIISYAMSLAAMLPRAVIAWLSGD